MAATRPDACRIRLGRLDRNGRFRRNLVARAGPGERPQTTQKRPSIGVLVTGTGTAVGACAWFCFSLAKQPREALHEASAGRDAEQDSPVHLFPDRKLCEARGDAVGRNHHGDGSLTRVAAVFVWHGARYARGWLPNR
jgi:hypothetical protein